MQVESIIQSFVNSTFDIITKKIELQQNDLDVVYDIALRGSNITGVVENDV